MGNRYLVMGHEPMAMRLRLTNRGFRWQEVLSEDWPVGSSLSLVVGADIWPATISGTVAEWNVDAATTSAVPDGTAVELVYSDADGEVLWGKGTVVRYGA